MACVGSIPLYLEMQIPSDYPDAAPQPDLSNINNAPYAPAVKQQAVSLLLAEVSSAVNSACSLRQSVLGVHELHSSAKVCDHCMILGPGDLALLVPSHT